MSKKKTRGPRATAAQHAALLSFLENEKGLAEGKFAALHGKEMARKKWEDLANEINKIPGAFKSADQWQIVWRDMKSKASSKFKILKRERAKTGNKPLSEDFLSPLEERIVGIVGWEYMMGNESVPDSFDTTVLNEEITITGQEENFTETVEFECEASISEVPTTSNCGNGNKSEIPKKRQKRECSIKEEFLQIAKTQADAMMNLANAQKETAKALNKISDSFVVLNEILASYKRMKIVLSNIEESVKLNNFVFKP
ncbi:uncharacterized protein LOC119601750 [Lucilia sericata]|uniref:uncharacterized protein LOC119601750 n=1 Tax=Lucilia sericata TaxID=13632 RepID=UPI0018A85FF0|nr:uncharacterized protein LOC119601750 [Lucilia sericata]